MLRIFWAAPALVLLASCGSNDNPAPGLPGICALPRAAAASAYGPAAESDGHRFLVKVKAHGPVPEARSLAVRSRLERIGTTKEIAPGLFLVESAAGLTKEGVRASAGDEAEYVEPDYVARAALASDDPDIGKQWAHGVVHSEEAWDIGRGDASVVVAMLDSGTDISHEDLSANIWTNPGEVAGNGLDDDGDGYVDDVHGWNFVSDTNDVTADDAHMHGTHVSGTIGAVGNNGIGISGHAQMVSLMPLKFLSASGSGYTSNAIRAIDYAISKGAKIISNSWGSFGHSQSLDDAIGRAEAAGILFVAAAGNNGTNNSRVSFYPANSRHDNVISVAASTSSDSLAGFSDYGTLVHLAAPGSKIYSTKNGNTYQTMSGTSMATPLVSGVLAMMVALRPDLSYRQIKGALLASVDNVPSMYERLLWNGRINAYKAMQLVQSIPADWQPPEPPAHVCP